MLSKAILKQTVLENALQPVFVVAVIVEIALLALVCFGLSFHYEGDVLVSVDLLRSHHEENVGVMIDTLLKTFFGLARLVLMFLFLLVASSFYPDWLQNPLLGISLTKPVSRTGLFISRFGGLSLLVFVNTMAFALTLWGALTWKTNGHLPADVLLAALSFWFEFVVMFGVATLFSMVLENTTGVMVFIAAIYFYVSPMLALSKDNDLITKVSSFIVPPVGAISLATQDLIGGMPAAFEPYMTAVPYLVLCIALASYLFYRRDIN